MVRFGTEKDIEKINDLRKQVNEIHAVHIDKWRKQ